MLENTILLNSQKMEETKYKSTEWVEALRHIARCVDTDASFAFGAGGAAESKGPCSKKMQTVTAELKDTINCMADTSERLLLFLLQAGINIEDMDDFLSQTLHDRTSGGQ